MDGKIAVVTGAGGTLCSVLSEKLAAAGRLFAIGYLKGLLDAIEKD